MILEIEDQLVEQLEAAAKKRGVSVRELVHSILRQGIGNVELSSVARYKLPTRDFGAHLEHPWGTLAEAEYEDILKTAKK